MAKQKKSRKHKKYTPKKDIKPCSSKSLSPEHRFDKEIADACSTILLRIQMRRLEQPTAVEREIRKEIKETIAKRELSRVATDFFDSIIDICSKQPFVKAATRILNATYQEYVIVKAHMEALATVPMKERVQGLADDVKADGWHIELLHTNGQKMPDEPFNLLTMHEDWEQKCDPDGQLLEPMSLAVRNKEVKPFIEMAYQRGILLNKIGAKCDHYHFKIHPDNNIPGIPLSPPSIKIEP